jgi:hypothetical protein
MPGDSRNYFYHACDSLEYPKKNINSVILYHFMKKTFNSVRNNVLQKI